MTEGETGAETIKIIHPHVLLVEGYDDVDFFAALLSRMAVADVQLIQMEGKSNLRDRVGATAMAPNFAASVVAVGVVRDANGDPDAAADSIRGALEAAGLPAPREAMLVEDGRPRVIYTLFPKQAATGMLEDLCLESVGEDEAMECVDDYFRCLDAAGGPRRKNESKARLQAFLASREESGKRLGIAALAGYFPWNHSAFDEMKQFVNSLRSE